MNSKELEEIEDIANRMKKLKIHVEMLLRELEEIVNKRINKTDKGKNDG